jgi:hypothetical protein
VIETLCIAKSCPKYRLDAPSQLLEWHLSVSVASVPFQLLFSTVQANDEGRKSQLAIEYSYQVRESSPDIWVFWVHASSAARFQEGYREIANRVKIAGWDNPETNILQLVNNWLRNEANGRWFMVIDNADDASVFLHSADESKVGDDSNKAALSEDLSEYLPQSQNGSILVTSRSRDVAFRITGDTRDIIPVDPMDERVAVDLLRRKLQGDFNENDAERVLHALDYMPLAITQAAAFINQ